ncbi:MAG: S1-like domain-containing RNA-binding protein [Lachnospiraceae bacterium]|nr:S1-like domain-containing RNA-binding protein [Lachnospiraceae bacterium]
MFQLGRKQELFVVKMVDFGVYLGEEVNAGMDDRVLLPKKQVPENIQPGDKIEVFLYKDSKDRIIATTKMPKLMVGEVGLLTVSQVTRIGAFLNWGLEKDILLPYKEQTKKVFEGEEVLVALYIDKSKRLAATMNVYEYLDTDSEYRKDDMVTGTVYQMSEEYGAFVAVDNHYSALIPKREIFGEVRVGDTVKARVTSVKADGKLDLSIREKAYIQIEKDAQKILTIIDSFDGVLPFTDRANPEVIKRETQMSKNEFKRAIGNLLKKGKIEIRENCIRRK